jgi:hypothetical protein
MENRVSSFLSQPAFLVCGAEYFLFPRAMAAHRAHFEVSALAVASRLTASLKGRFCALAPPCRCPYFGIVKQKRWEQNK